MSIVPDTKDWTWVLDAPCPDCGFTASALDPSLAADRVVAMVPRWREVLERSNARTRPDASTWSALEYGCHVRDVLRIFADRSRLIREHEEPGFANWDQDAAALEQDYGGQDPEAVAAAIAVAATAYAAELARTTDWGRPGRRSNGSAFTARTLTAYCLHDLVHHLEYDVRG